MEASRSRKQPVDFRADETSYIMQRWQAAESCSLVGVGSIGKSNLLQHLATPAVHKTYMDTTPSEFKPIIIDPSMLGPLPESGADRDAIRCWAGYELMMHRLIMAFYPLDVLGKDDAKRFYDVYNTLQDGTNPLYAYMGLRYFELGLNFFMQRGIRIVFMFDEFEDMLKLMPVKFFLTLRGLRDANKRHLSYLTFTRSPITSLVEQFGISTLEIEPFTELFTDSIMFVGPYNERDSRRMIDGLMARYNKQYPEPTIRFLQWATGGYAGLLRSTFRLLDTLGTIDSTSAMNDETVQKLMSRNSIQTECKTIWTSLSPAEHEVLRSVVGLRKMERTPEFEQSVTLLARKRLILPDRARNTLQIEPPIFRQYVAMQREQES